MRPAPRMRPAPNVTRLLLAAVVVIAAGCGGGDGRRPARFEAADPAPPRPAAALPPAVRQQLLDGALTVLGRLDAYDEAAAFAQVFDRLNQWSHGAIAAAGDGQPAWSLDPLHGTLPPVLRAVADADALESGVFVAEVDVPALRDQRWLADIAASARGDAVDDVEVARNLFAWTVRSLAITSDPPLVPTDATPGTRWFSLGDVLLAGRASGAQRAWVFLELLRHAGLDGVMLATGDAAAGPLRPWLPALVSGGEAFLFEPVYGLPVPGPEGAGVATVRQAAADPAILRALSLPDRAYPVQAADLAKLSVLVPAAPVNLARRMHLLDGQLAGVAKVDLAIAATELGATALAALPGPADPGRVRLWEFPWETARRGRAAAVAAAAAQELAPFVVALEATVPDGRETRRTVRPLYAARLREFRGELDGPDGAKAAYMLARPSAVVIADVVKRSPSGQAAGLERLYETMKEDATYWLGVLTLGEGQYETAVDYLGRMVLEAAPDSRWADAARTNLAAAQAALGRTAEA
ncbi:MAG: hypothetical protein EBZ74_01475, partial [Planctomycetia bacterium]|nr:hypothetical protein [Planctomycetia bacterium]